MAKKDISNGITKISVNDLPAFMKDETITGIDALKNYIVPPRIKIVQKSAADEVLKSFSAGDVILTPMNAAIAEMERDAKGRPVEGAVTAFNFVPIFFFPEWATCNPIELKGSAPFLRYRTTNPTDPVAIKARNAALRDEICPEDPTLKIRHVEFLNYIVSLYNHPLGNEPIVLSFAKGEWSAGSKFAALIKMRQAPIYGCIFQASVALRHGQFGDWYGLNIANPNPDKCSPWVTAEEYEVCKKLHLNFVELHKESRLKVQIEPDINEADDAAVAGNSEF